jgi:hypothetical protein
MSADPIITCKSGKQWRVDEIIRGKRARRVQIAPGWGQLNLSPPVGNTRCHFGVAVKESAIDDVLAGRILIFVGYRPEAEKGES